ncbi:MAG: DNA polymerase III subunit alpha, partial [Gemmataceae bacterium]
ATRQWVDIARKLEGMNRNAGTHAAGVVIANGPITDYVPVHRAVRRGDGNGPPSRADFKSEPAIATQWVMGDLEKVGMLKIDFLGLRTLTLLNNTVKLIAKTRGKTIDIEKIPIDDLETYRMLGRGDAKGVFQFESDGIRELLKRLKPDNIRDIIACTALYRPGPLESGMVEEYIDCKHGRKKPTYPHSIMEEITRETHGVLVYQEQVMRTLNRMGNIDLASAYACIKAISKKKQEIIDARRVDFVKGAQTNGLSRDVAEEIFALIVKFGGYGFNKSHSAAYAYVSYQTAYLKRHYTAEFMAALLSSEIDDGNKRDMLVDHIADARKFGLDVLPPDVNTGEADFTVHAGKIVFGLTAIKGLGRGAAEDIVRARQEGGAFRDLFDFCERVDQRVVQKAAIEKLIKAGAFDTFGRRSALFQVLPRAIQAADEKQEDRRRGQRSFFDVLDEANGNAVVTAEPLPDVAEWPEGERLKFEKEALDFYLSSHPLAQHDSDLRRYAVHSVEASKKLDDGREVLIGGMMTMVRFFTSKKSNKRYARCKIEDFTGLAECVIWPDNFDRHAELFVDDQIVLAQATLERMDRDEPVFVLSKLLTIEQARRELTTGMLLKMSLRDHGPEHIEALARLLRRSPGSCKVELLVTDAAGRRAQLRVGRDLAVDPAKIALDELEMIVGRGGVVFTGK